MDVELVCPLCRYPLRRGALDLQCRSCGRRYPVVAGIPDLRLRGDRYLSLEADRAKAVALDEVPGGFEDALRAYWAWTPEVPAPLAERYVRSTLDGVHRGDRHLDRAGAHGGSLLDVGCGTGGLLVAAAHRGCAVAGVDIALRWLVVARRRLAEAGVDALLVAADGAVPPFPSASFDTVCCVEVLEHTSDQRGLLHWSRALARPDGRSYVVTANRFSILPEPTIGLVGVGWLPRSWAPAYVRLRRTTRYQYFRAPSVRELREWTAADGTDGRARRPVIAPAVLPAPGRSSPIRLLVRVYDALGTRAVPASLLLRIGPYVEVTA